MDSVNMDKDEIIKTLYEHRMRINSADSLAINYETSCFYCFIKKTPSLFEIYKSQVEKYKKLRENTNFQNSVMRYFRQVKNVYKKTGHIIYSYEFFTPLPFDDLKNTKKHITLLYLIDVESLIPKLSSQLQDYLQLSDITLLTRNLSIYSYYPECEQIKLLKLQFEITKSAEECYSFYFFDLEKRLVNIQLHEQIRIACRDIIKCFLYNLKRSKADADVSLLARKSLLTPREQEVYDISHLTRKEIASRLSITETTVQTHIKNICNKLNIPGIKEMRNFKD